MPTKGSLPDDLSRMRWIALGCAVVSMCLLWLGKSLGESGREGAEAVFLFSGAIALIGMYLGLMTRRIIGALAVMVCFVVLGLVLALGLFYWLGSQGHVS